MTFLLSSVFVFIIGYIYSPKKLEKAEIYIIFLFSIILGYTSDVILDLKYDLYGYFTKGVQFPGLLPIIFLFPISGFFFLNFYPYDKSLIIKSLYVAGWTAFCLIFEYLSIQSGYFYHNGWKYWHSLIVYPLLLWIHLTHLKFVRKHILTK